MLTTLFAWIKDLPEVLQQRVLSSFSMQQILKLLERTVYPDKFITYQLSNQPAEEKFAAEYQKYFGQDGFISNPQEYAQVNQDNFPVLMDKDVEIISGDGILIDPLPKQDINFGAPNLFSNIAS